MPTIQKDIGNKSCKLYATVHNTKVGPPNIEVGFNRNGLPWTKKGKPSQRESEHDAILRLFGELRKEVIKTAQDNKWPGLTEIRNMFTEFRKLLIRQAKTQA